MGVSWALGDVSVGLTLGPGRDTQREPLSWAASLGLNEAEKIQTRKICSQIKYKKVTKNLELPFNQGLVLQELMCQSN